MRFFAQIAFNAHHKELLGSISPATGAHGCAAFEFFIVSGCEQLIEGLTYQSGFFAADVNPVVLPVFGAPLGSSDHSVISFKLIIDLEWSSL